MFSADLRSKAQSLVDRYPVGRSALLPLLHLVQHQDGYISDDGIAECAQLLGLTKAEVAAVATFYSMYKRRPVGRHLVSVCTNFACEVRGAGDVYRRLSDHLGVGHNETTPDGAVTLEHAECLGNCDGAPVVTVDYFNYECLTPEAAQELVERVVGGDVPAPTRGYRPRGILSAQHRLAGLGPLDGDEPGAPVDQATAGDAAEPPPDAGPGAPGPLDGTEPDARLPEFAHGADGGAEQRGPDGLDVDSGTGSTDERDAATGADPRTGDQAPAADRGEADDPRPGAEHERQVSDAPRQPGESAHPGGAAQESAGDRPQRGDEPDA